MNWPRALVRRTFVVSCVAWALMLPIGPALGWWARSSAALWTLAAIVYSTGAALCHQLPARSFHLAGTPLPVCARCTGIYVAAAAACLALAMRRPVPAPRSWRRVFAAAAVPTAATLLFEWTTGVTPSNVVRALAGMPLGAAAAWAIVAVTSTDYEVN